ncbi:MAG: ABC transporter permease [Acidimicrobiales bacterium]|nr:ABC transporter permease [Acidimicrobiia bacterium]MBT8215744.1 ABC transporter permease [Acidimicrobiia bacterium]NNF56290.1 ABC transporter permease [Acidimicrobiales bacterium]NNL69991.1 ABC transporter permease [Acidimicrobiia bacterium]
MGRYAIRRTLGAIPTLVVISFVIFAILDLAPGDPTANLPLTVPPEAREQIRETLGLNDPFLISWVKWMRQMFINEPLNVLETMFGLEVGDSEGRLRIISWASRGPAVDTIVERLPQTLWVLGLGFILGIVIAIPVGVISAYKQYSIFDNVGTFVSMIGYSVPTFFTGLVAIIIFSVWLGWFPSFYDTTHDVSLTDWDSIVFQFQQMIMPVTVLALFNAAALSRFTRSSMLDNLTQDYVRTARSKGLTENRVLMRHVLRNSLIPVTTLIALQVPGIFAGAIITEQIFRINGLGQLLISAIQGADVPMVQTLTFIFAFLIVVFNLIADLIYGVLDPRIRYE